VDVAPDSIYRSGLLLVLTMFSLREIAVLERLIMVDCYVTRVTHSSQRLEPPSRLQGKHITASKALCRTASVVL
jgi:hypothetical protein